MFFLSRHSALYATAAQAKPWQRYACTLMLAAFMAYATVYFSAYLAARITQYEHEVRTLKQQVDQRVSAAAQIKKLQEALKDAQYSLRLKAIEGKKNSPIPFLLQQARAAHIAITSCSQEQGQSKDWYTKQVLAVEATGSFDNIISFLEKLRISKQMVQCRNFQITQTEPHVCTISCTLSMRQLSMHNELVRI